MSKLDEMKAVLADYDIALSVRNSLLRSTVADDERWKIYEAAEKANDTLMGFAPDYLRLLLPIVEAAQNFVNHPDESHPDLLSKSYYATLKDALKALEGEGS